MNRLKTFKGFGRTFTVHHIIATLASIGPALFIAMRLLFMARRYGLIDRVTDFHEFILVMFIFIGSLLGTVIVFVKVTDRISREGDWKVLTWRILCLGMAVVSFLSVTYVSWHLYRFGSLSVWEIHRSAREDFAKARSSEDLDQAVTKWKRLLWVAGIINPSPSREARLLTYVGGVYSALDDFTTAAEYYSKSLELARRINEWEGVASGLNNMGTIYLRMNDYPKAADYYRRSLNMYTNYGQRKQSAVVLGNLGYVYAVWGKLAKASTYFQESLKHAVQTGDLSGQSGALNCLGQLQVGQGQYSEAMHLFSRALDVSRKMRSQSQTAQTIQFLGAVYETWGQYSKALDSYHEALRIFKNLKALSKKAGVLADIADVYRRLGQFDKALEFYEKSLTIRRRLNDLSGQARILFMLAMVNAAEDKFDEALRVFRQARKIRRKIHLSTKSIDNQMANLYLDMGRTDKAEPLIDQSGYKWTRGRLALSKSLYEQAGDYYDQIRKKAEISRNVDNQFIAFTGLGLSSEGLGDYPKAIKHYVKAVKLVEDLRKSLPVTERQTFFIVKVKGFFRTAPYEGLARVLMRLNRPGDALNSSELTKARVFADAMTQRHGATAGEVPPQVMEEGNSLVNQIAALKKRRRNAQGKHRDQVIANLAPQILDLEIRLKAHIKMVRQEYPLFAATKYPEPMDLAQTALTENEWVLSYDVTDSGLLIYLTKGKKIVKALSKPIPRKDVDALVKGFRAPVSGVAESPDPFEALKMFDFTTGKKLSDILLSDILPHIPKGVPLVVIPDESLGVLPFEMLLLSDKGKIKTDKGLPYISGAQFFGDRNPISYYQSITALTLARLYGGKSKKAEKTLAMCDPVFHKDDPRIAQAKAPKKVAMRPFTQEKLTSMSAEMGLSLQRLPQTTELGEFLNELHPNETDVFFGLEATKARLLSLPLDHYRSIVFATHGAIENEVPGIMEPVLFLTIPGQPDDKDGFLRLSEVMGLTLNAEVVALTACQTGLGRRISGEGVMGMGRAFQYAGAKSALMSLWKVAAEPSVMMMKSFFTHLKEGKSKLEALDLARQEIRKAGYDHPVFWAGFILAGEVN